MTEQPDVRRPDWEYRIVLGSPQPAGDGWRVVKQDDTATLWGRPRCTCPRGEFTICPLHPGGYAYEAQHRIEAVRAVVQRWAGRPGARQIVDEIGTALHGQLDGGPVDVGHRWSCPEHTNFKVCYCDCGACRPDGVCACQHCGEWHPGHTTTETK